MISSVEYCSNATANTPSLNSNQRLITWVVERRVPITSIIFLILVLGSIANGLHPHSLTNVYDTKAWMGLSLVVAGLTLRSWAAGILRKYSSLTTEGPYSLVRNPLYVGSFMMMVGFCTLIDQAHMLAIVVGPFLLLFICTVRHEETLLASQFDGAWEAYSHETPRFVPRRLRVTRAGHWSTQQWRKNREYQAVFATILGLLALQLWQKF